MTNPKKVLNQFIKKILELYFEAVFPDEPNREFHISESNFTIYNWTVAGAYFELEQHKNLCVPTVNPERLWSSVNFDLNDKTVNVGVIVYIEGGYVETIEVFAALNDLPDEITSFELNPERF
jgi:hypothetical protein